MGSCRFLWCCWWLQAAPEQMSLKLTSAASAAGTRWCRWCSSRSAACAARCARCAPGGRAMSCCRLCRAARMPGGPSQPMATGAPPRCVTHSSNPALLTPVPSDRHHGGGGPVPAVWRRAAARHRRGRRRQAADQPAGAGGAGAGWVQAGGAAGWAAALNGARAMRGCAAGLACAVSCDTAAAGRTRETSAASLTLHFCRPCLPPSHKQILLKCSSNDKKFVIEEALRALQVRLPARAPAPTRLHACPCRMHCCCIKNCTALLAGCSTGCKDHAWQ